MRKQRHFYPERSYIKNALKTPRLDFGHISHQKSHEHGGMELAERDSRANLLEASLATSQEGGVATPSNSPIGKMQDGHTFPPCCGILSQTLFSTQCLLLGFLPARLGKEKNKSHSNGNSLPQQRWLSPHDHCVELLQKSLTSPPCAFTLSNKSTLRTKSSTGPTLLVPSPRGGLDVN